MAPRTSTSVSSSMKKTPTRRSRNSTPIFFTKSIPKFSNRRGKWGRSRELREYVPIFLVAGDRRVDRTMDEYDLPVVSRLLENQTVRALEVIRALDSVVETSPGTGIPGL